MRLLADMEAFVEVAKLRNFGRAAAAIGITASTLSRRVANLEKEMGLVLIRRSTRTFVLTEPGQKFYERSKSLVEEAARTREELSAGFTKVAGILRVGSPSDLATTFLAPVFAKYCRENVSVSLGIVSTPNQPDLQRDRLDLAFAVAHQVPMSDSLNSVRQVGAFSRMMYASKAYLKRKGFPNTPQELQAHHCIRYIDGSTEQHWELHDGRKHQTVQVNGSCTSNSVIISAQAAREHLGIAMLPQHLASHPTYGAGLIRVLNNWEGTRAIVFAVTADRALPAKTEEMVRVVKSEFDKQLAQLESVYV